jgi:hypothetical protein
MANVKKAFLEKINELNTERAKIASEKQVLPLEYSKKLK